MMRMVRRSNPSKNMQILMRAGSVVAALAAAALLMAALGYNPFLVYYNMVAGSFGTAYRLQATIHKVIPLLVLSLGIAVAFKMKFWNIGAEGQMAMGGFGAAYAALKYGALPPYILLPLMFVLGMICGGIWGVIPAILKVKLGTNETLVTLMLNYIALRWLTYLQYGPWKVGGFPRIPDFSPNAVLPSLFGIHIGWMVAVLLTAAVYVMLRRTKLGYEIAVLGESESTARYAGINVSKVTIVAMLISGAVCGLAGMMQTSAVEKTLTEQFTGGLGFTAVITTWLARLSPIGMIGTSFAFAMLIQGGGYLETTMSISSKMADVLQGVIIFFVLGCDFFIQYKIQLRKPVRKGGEAK
ncbi:MAG: ABC transporter permease [Oscillospiraceae bacterium]|nr:ABC transporter permease [Oscillospiraceae bacterium]